MSLSSITRAAAVALALVAAPLALRAQSVVTVCLDGSRSASSGAGTCSGHGGVDRARTAALSRRTTTTNTKSTTTSSRKSSVATAAERMQPRVAQAGKPAAAPVRKPMPVREHDNRPRLPAAVPANSPARERSHAKSHAPSAQVAARKHDDGDDRETRAQCRDGSFSKAKGHKGACSHHGGVAKWLN